MIANPCIECRGDGRIHRAQKVVLTIPKGVDDGMVLRLNGQGDAGAKGAAPGNLLVGVHVTPHETFKRKGDDLYLETTVCMAEAALGTKVTVPLLGGEAEEVAVPPGTQAGHVTTLRGRGMPRLQRHGSGNLKVLFVVETPEDLSPKEKELLKEFARLRGKNGRDARGSTGTRASTQRKQKRGWFGNISDLLAGDGHDDR